MQSAAMQATIESKYCSITARVSYTKFHAEFHVLLAVHAASVYLVSSKHFFPHTGLFYAVQEFN